MKSKYVRSIDELLGDRSARYFGDGYLSVDHHISDPQVYRAGEKTFYSFHASVLVSEVWSQKGGAEQTPHLSTIDVLELTTLCLAAISERTWAALGYHVHALGSLSIVSGKSPIEKLDSIPIAGVLQIDQSEREASELELGIANMTVRIPLAVDRTHAPAILHGLRQASTVTDVLIHTDGAGASVASALVTPKPSNVGEVWGLGVSFAATLQLGQALLYDLDGIDRARSHTLWMKRTSVTMKMSASTFDGSQPLNVRLENVRKYEKQDVAWRRADVVGLIADRTISCSVTHQLPSS